MSFEYFPTYYPEDYLTDLPVRKVLAVRAPMEALAKLQFLFIYPVEGAVDQSLGTIVR